MNLVRRDFDVVEEKDGKWNVNGSSIYWGVFFRMMDEELPIKNPCLADRERLWGPSSKYSGNIDLIRFYYPIICRGG